MLYVTHELERLCETHKILFYKETILVNTFMGINKIVHSKVLQMFMQYFDTLTQVSYSTAS